MGGAQAQVVANPLGVQEAELEADKGAPVVADQMDPAEFECLQQCHASASSWLRAYPLAGASVQPAPRRSGQTTR